MITALEPAGRCMGVVLLSCWSVVPVLFFAGIPAVVDQIHYLELLLPLQGTMRTLGESPLFDV
jgi:hypothetical protein